MAVTLQDIARKANVSTATVSRVLNNYAYVNQLTREAVWQTADALGYSRNGTSTQSRKPRSILLLRMGHFAPIEYDRKNVGPHHQEFLRLVQEGVYNILPHQNYDMQVHAYHRYGYDFQTEIKQFSLLDLMGVILLSGRIQYDFLHLLQQSRLPFVIVGVITSNSSFNAVMADYMHGIEQAIRHLAQSGRRRIGLVNSSAKTLTNQEKYKAFRLALTLHDLEFHPHYVTDVDSEIPMQTGCKHTRRLLEQAPDIDALIYGDDYLAVGGMRAIKESGRRIPDDVAVIGFHNYEIARFTDPQLTTVHFSMQDMGAIAARRLLMLIEESPGEEPWHILTPTSLVLRQSA
jgi:DNA-binding LacI/PurR family transcriptional regulator